MESNGLSKVLELLGERITSLESSERYARKDVELYRAEREACREKNFALVDEINDLKAQLAKANEKIHEYEEAVIIDKDGKLVKFKDLLEIEIPGEFEQEIRASLDRGKAPDKASK